MDNEAPSIPPIPRPPTVPMQSPVQPQEFPMLCPQCYLPVPAGAHFCPNCGKKLNEPDLPTDIGAQILLYGFSIVLPIICFLAVSYWQGIKYARSHNPKAQEMGWIAIALLAISTIITFWIFGVWVNQFIQSATSTAGLSQYGI